MLTQPIGRPSPHDASRHQRAATPVYFPAPLMRGFFFGDAMNADLTRLIRLQHLETAADEARRKVAEHPARTQALDARLQAARDVRRRHEGPARRGKRQTARRGERRRQRADAAREIQGSAARGENQPRVHGNAPRNRDGTKRHPHARGSHSRDHAGVRRAECRHQEERGGAQGGRKGDRFRARPARCRDGRPAGRDRQNDGGAREARRVDIDRHVLSIFEITAKSRKGVAVAEAKDGLCIICHVRLRPQVFNEVRKNESIIQCDSCRRILYFAGNAETSTPVSQI